jgi:hypothetical protein
MRAPRGAAAVLSVYVVPADEKLAQSAVALPSGQNPEILSDASQQDGTDRPLINRTSVTIDRRKQ